MNSTVSIEGKDYACVREGLADILAPKLEAGKESTKTRSGGEEQSVFYNPIQAFNRDLSVLAAKVFAEEVAAIRKQRKSKNQSKNTAANPGKRKRDVEGRDDAGVEVPGAKKSRTDEASLAPAGAQETTSEPSRPTVEAGLEATDPKKLETGEAIPAVASAQETASEPTHAAADAGPVNSGAEPIERAAESTPQSPPKPHFRILDALSATGLRALRYAKEVPEADLITANDLSHEAVASIKRNVDYNGVQDRVYPIHGNAAGHMYKIGSGQTQALPDGTSGRYDIIDLDPYGTAAPFIDAAVQAVSDGGMLAVTCTDSAVFASVGYLEKTYAQYGGLPWKGSQSHEAGLRLIIHSVATSAARYGLAIEPLLSLSIDYYVRIFIRVRKVAAEVKLLPGKTLTVFNCDTGCGAWTKQYHTRSAVRENKKGEKFYHFTAAQGPTSTPHCEHCGFRTHVAGPMWGGFLHNPAFVQRLVDKLPHLDPTVYTTKKRLEGTLDTALKEIFPLIDTTTDGVSAKNGVTKSQYEYQASKNGVQTRGIPSESAQPEVKPMSRLEPALADPNPFFLIPSELARILRIECPSEASLRGALIGLGYRVTQSHCKPNSVRTDAPWSVIWDVMRAWVRHKGGAKGGALKDGTPGAGIWRSETSNGLERLETSLQSYLGDDKKVKAALAMIEAMNDPAKADATGTDGIGSTETAKGTEEASVDTEGLKVKDKENDVSKPTLTTAASGERKPVVFDSKLGRDPDKGRFVRYQMNPRENWGPQSRAR